MKMQSETFFISVTPGGCGDQFHTIHADNASERGNIHATHFPQSKSKSNLTATPKRSCRTPVRSNTPISKFTAARSVASTPNKNLEKIKQCLDMDNYSTPQTSSPETDERSKAVSMENLTPAKKTKGELMTALTAKDEGAIAARTAAGTRLGFALVLAAWRRRRAEAASLRRGAALAATANERSRRKLQLMQALLEGDAEKLRRALSQIAKLKRKISDCEERNTNVAKEAEAVKQSAELANAAARQDITGLTAKLTFECMATLQAEEKAARLFIELDKKNASLAASEAALQAAKKAHTLAELQWVCEARKNKWRRPFDRWSKLMFGWLLGVPWQRALLYTVLPTANRRGW